MYLLLSLDKVNVTAKKIPGTLLPFTDRLYTGTPDDPESLYGAIMQTFNDTIADTAGTEGSSGQVRDLLCCILLNKMYICNAYSRTSLS